MTDYVNSKCPNCGGDLDYQPSHQDNPGAEPEEIWRCWNCDYNYFLLEVAS